MKIRVLVAGLACLSSGAWAEEFAIRCTGRSIDFRAIPGTEPKVESQTLPEQTFIVDPTKERAWRWLPPKEERDLMCGTKDCMSTFNPRSINLFWSSPSELFVTSSAFELDRVTGHASYELKMQRGGELLYHYWDMMCERAPMPETKARTKI